MRFKKFIDEVLKDYPDKFDLQSDDGLFYVYRVTSLVDHKHYYGNRKSRYEDLLLDFKKYGTSSKRKAHILANPDSYKVKILKTFNNRALCNLYESFLHTLFNVRKNDKFFNMWNAPINTFNTAGFILIKDDKSTKGKLIPVEDYDQGRHERFCDRTGYTVVKDNDGNTFSIPTDDRRYNKTLFNVNKDTITVTYKDNPGQYFNVDVDEFYTNRKKYKTVAEDRIVSEEARVNYSNSAKNRKKLTCPYCSKEGHPSNMYRWHFDNCKFKPGNENLKRECPNKNYFIERKLNTN